LGVFAALKGCQTGPFGVLGDFWREFLEKQIGLSRLDPIFFRKIRVEPAQPDLHK